MRKELREGNREQENKNTRYFQIKINHGPLKSDMTDKYQIRILFNKNKKNKILQSA